MHVCWRNVIIVAPHCGDVDIAVEMWGAQCGVHNGPPLNIAPDIVGHLHLKATFGGFFFLCVINVSNVSQHIYPVFFSYFGRAMIVISHLRC